MVETAAVVGWIACAGAFAGAAYAVACIWAVSRFCKTPPEQSQTQPAVSVLKPLHGAEPRLAENLETFCNQRYAAPIQLVLGMDANDFAARCVAEHVAAIRPEREIAIASGAARHGSNPKVSNLINLFAAATHDVLVISDSDIAVPQHYVAVIAAAIDRVGIGAVTCCYTGAPAAPGLWPRLSAMGINQRFLPDALFAISHDLVSPCFGSTIAIKRKVLAEIGGFQAFANLLADDYEIGRAVRARGYRIAVPGMTVTHNCSESSASELLRHELRWARTIRTINPLGFGASIITHPVPFALLACLMWGFSEMSLAALAVALAGRVTLAARINSEFRTGDPIWLVPLRDLLSFVVFIRALFATRVEWRGARFRVTSAGALAQD